MKTIQDVLEWLQKSEDEGIYEVGTQNVKRHLESVLKEQLRQCNVSGSLSIDDLHLKLRSIFFDKMKEHWVDDDMIHMDYVSDAFDETILLFLEDCH